MTQEFDTTTTATTTTPATPPDIASDTVNPQASTIVFDDFLKVNMKVGKVVNAELIEKSEKLLKLNVDFGEEQARQVISGIREAFPDPQTLIGRTFAFVTNLEPRKILGLESQAMIIAAKDENGMALFEPTTTLAPGTSLS